MKKIFIFILSIIACLTFLCSCNQKEGKLIEITGEELLTNMNSEDGTNFIFAIWNSERDNAEEFMKSLKSVATNAKIDIYYVDYQNISIEYATFLFTMFDYDISYNSYYVFKNNQYAVENEYSDFKTLYSELKGYAFHDEFTYVSEDTKKEYFEEAKKLLEEGHVGLSKEKLNLSWTLEEAKEFYKNNPIYKILNEWEHYTYTDDDNTYVDYNTKIFFTKYNFFYEAKKTGKFEGFEKPIKYIDYTQVYFYIKDNIIYTSNSENGKYKEKYRISYIDDENLHFIDLKTNKKYEYIKR